MANPPDLDLQVRNHLRQQHPINRFACPHCENAKFYKEEPLWSHFETYHVSLIPTAEKERVKFRATLRSEALSKASVPRTSRKPENGSTPRDDSKEYASEVSGNNVVDKSSGLRLPAQSIQLDVRIAGLSLDQAREAPNSNGDSSGRRTLSHLPANKRPASSDIGIQASDNVAGHTRASGATAASSDTLVSAPPSKYVKRSAVESRAPQSKAHLCTRGEPTHKQLYNPDKHPRVSSRKPTIQKCIHAPEPRPQTSTVPLTGTDVVSEKPSSHAVSVGAKGILEMPLTARHVNMIPQPDSKPITHDQLAAEVKGIYSALILVEAKCIKLDSAQTATESKHKNLPHEQWQALIALHRTLLYEHHDFLSATQHPSARQSLKVLVTKYSMPARMWKHGIHSFLEVLRHRLPESIDYMLQFVYIAYQMMALLYETVGAYRETWIECLGDLARYRMAIEENDMRDREIWGGTACMWYSKASNDRPDVGRLYHHLGILARPNAVQQLYFYCRSLISVQPFQSAQESLRTLFEPLAHSETQEGYQPKLPGVDETDSIFLSLHAAMFGGSSAEKLFQSARLAYLSRLDRQIEHQGARWKDHGVFIAVANIAACLQFGQAGNALIQAFTKTTNLTSNKQQIASIGEAPGDLQLPGNMFYQILTIVLRRKGDYNVLPHVHVVLIFVRSIFLIGATVLAHQILQRFPWKDLAAFLNSFTEREEIESNNAGYKSIVAGGVKPTEDLPVIKLQCAPPGSDSVEGEEDNEASRSQLPKPLPEDYLLRGMVWCQTHFTKNWFDNEYDEESRLIDLRGTNETRAQRVLLMSFELSKQQTNLEFDAKLKTFSSSSDTDYKLPNQLMLESVSNGTSPETMCARSNKVEDVCRPLNLGPSVGLKEVVVESKSIHKVQVADQDDLQYGVY